MRMRPSVPHIASNGLRLVGSCNVEAAGLRLGFHVPPVFGKRPRLLSALDRGRVESRTTGSPRGRPGSCPFRYHWGLIRFWRCPLWCLVCVWIRCRLNVQSGQRKCHILGFCGLASFCGESYVLWLWHLSLCDTVTSRVVPPALRCRLAVPRFVGVSVAPLGGGPLKRWSFWGPGLGFTLNLWGAALGWVFHPGILPPSPLAPRILNSRGPIGARVRCQMSAAAVWRRVWVPCGPLDVIRVPYFGV